MSYRSLLVCCDGGVFTLTLNRPERLNAVDIPTLEEIVAALEEARRSQARVFVLAGSGSAFCAGADQREMVPRSADQWERIVDRYLDRLRALAYAKDRRAFGKPIGSFQGLAWMLADMATAIEAARLLTLQAAWKAARGEPHVLEASRAKLFATETCTRVTEQALQIHGGYGYAMESSLQRFYRDCKVLEIGEGTSQIQRNTIAHQLGLPALG